MANEVSLDFVARQLERVLDRLGAIEDQLAVLICLASRHDATVAALRKDLKSNAATWLEGR